MKLFDILLTYFMENVKLGNPTKGVVEKEKVAERKFFLYVNNNNMTRYWYNI